MLLLVIVLVIDRGEIDKEPIRSTITSMSTSGKPGAAGMWPRLLVVLALWAAMYLPALGTLEIKGEEGRRILPAVTMLETGDYVLPHIGGQPYLLKPPLVNWLVAASFRTFGVQNEWTARLPSTLCVLAVALTFLLVARPALGADGSFFAALMWLTNFAMIEKGRLIEIEALYVSLSALAFVYWLTWWQQRCSPWLTWVVPFIFLGFGLLAKGPLHLLFFYAIVFAVLLHEGELRKLWHPAHILGVLLMLAIFAAWAVPYLQATQVGQTKNVWTRQFTGRVSGEDFDLGGWIWNIPRAVAYALPWVVLLVFVRSAWSNRLVRSLCWGIAVPFLLVNLLPGALPRYTMPLLAPVLWLVALTLTTPAIRPPQLPHQLLAVTRPRFVISFATAIAAAILLYAVAIIPFLKNREKVKNIAAQVQAAIPAGERLYAVDPEYQPFLFYIREAPIYVARIDDLPAEARFVLTEARKVTQATQSDRWRTAAPRELVRLTDYRRKTVVLFELGEATLLSP